MKSIISVALLTCVVCLTGCSNNDEKEQKPTPAPVESSEGKGIRGGSIRDLNL